MTGEHNEQLGQIRVEMRDFQDEVREQLRLMKDNHLAHVQESMNRFQMDFVEVKSDVAWLLKFFWIIAGTSVASLLAIVFEH